MKNTRLENRKHGNTWGIVLGNGGTKECMGRLKKLELMRIEI